MLALPLLMPYGLADYVEAVAPANDLAIPADLFY
jgi:hypothetical protein